jgi:hypothetical protein
MKLINAIFAFEVKDSEYMVYFDLDERQYIIAKGKEIGNADDYLVVDGIAKGVIITADLAKSLLEKALK